MRRFLIICRLFVIFLFLINCEKEHVFNPDPNSPDTVAENGHHESMANYVSGEEIPEVLNKIYSKTGQSKSTGTTGKIAFSGNNVYLDSILEVVNDGKATNYTFELEIKGAAEGQFFNLVVSKTEDGMIGEPYIIGYQVTPEVFNYFINGGADYSRFKAAYTLYSFDRFFASGKVNKAIDCGAGTVGGGSAGGLQTPPGGTLVNSLNGNQVTTHFGPHSSTVSYYYNYYSSQTNNGQVNTVATVATSGVVTVETTGATASTVINVSPGTSNVSTNANTSGSTGSSGSGGCMSIAKFDNTWVIDFSGCNEYSGGDQNKGGLGARTDDCPEGNGGVAVLTPFTTMILNKTKGFLGLTQNAVDISRYNWLSHHITDACIPINQFVKANGESEEAREFANLAQLTLMDGGTVSFEDHVHLEDEVNNPCVKDILDKLQNKDMQRLTVPDIGRLEGTGHLAQGILDLFDGLSDLDIIFKVAEAGADKNASTNVVVSGGTPTIWTTIDEEFVENATQLAIARTIIHESIHGYLLYATNKNSQTETAILINDYRNQYGDLNIAHHEYMTQFVEAIGHSLSVWDNNQQSMEYYTNLAWSGGMVESNAFDQLTQQEQSAIINANIAEGSASNNATNNARGVKCN